MADVARTGCAYYSGYLSLNAASRAAAMERSRERRRRRFLMRRRANGGGALGVGERSPRVREEEDSNVVGYPVAADGFPWAAPGNGGVLIRSLESMRIGVSAAAGGQMGQPPAAAAAVEVERGNPVPVVGAIAVAGRLRYMEDAICIKANLCSPAINGFLPVHYFGVFDGHGGAHFSFMCKKKMNEFLEEELTGVPMQPYQMWLGYPAVAVAPPGIITDESVLQETWRRVMSRCFARTETVALHTCSCGSVGFLCRCMRTAVSFSGTTAVAVVLTEKHIVVANCGDSRAVLYRGGTIVPLSFDHKGDRRDEMARIEASGGRVLRTDTHRVEGILAMTRAIGDRFLKPLVISEPEVTFTRRGAEDEFMILASDGLWDVMSTQMAGDVTRECLKEPRDTVDAEIEAHDHDELGFGLPENEEPRILSPSRSASAAALLCRLAVARHSGDNISVVVVDLKRVASGVQNDDNVVMIGN